MLLISVLLYLLIGCLLSTMIVVEDETDSELGFYLLLIVIWPVIAGACLIGIVNFISNKKLS